MELHIRSIVRLALFSVSSVLLIELPASAQESAPGSGGAPTPTPPGGRGGATLLQDRFTFTFAPDSPLSDFLPKPPSVKSSSPVLTDDLYLTLEVEFQARAEIPLAPVKETEEIAHQLAKIKYLNAKKTDAFMTALLENRQDLAGMPFRMGNSCRLSGPTMEEFNKAVLNVRLALAAQSFWSEFTRLCEKQDAPIPSWKPEIQQQSNAARIAALTQMLAAESLELRLGLVDYLARIDRAEATRALARLAIFSFEDQLRNAAIESLKSRKGMDYTEVLVKGLRYPWPAVARRSAEAIARLGRSDLVPELEALLTSSDPRLPALRTIDGKETAVVRELVRVNHLRNCMMCHPPLDQDANLAGLLTAEVPTSGPSPVRSDRGYGQSQNPSLMIRIDVTYLRQDFSKMMNVPDANPHPEMQRFDFFVRERKLTSREAAEYAAKLGPTGTLASSYAAKLGAAGSQASNPYREAAIAALSKLVRP